MKGQTKHLTGQVREALLALPDTLLMEILGEWLDDVDEQLLDWGDECRSALGYHIQSDETHKIYGSFEELEQAEPDGAGGSWVVPDAQTLRTILGNLSLEQFYHSVIALAGEALALQASEEAWGFPPSVASDGYDFMRGLTVHLRYKALRRPEQGHISLYASSSLLKRVLSMPWRVHHLVPPQQLPSPHEVPPLLVDNENLYQLGTGLPTCYNSSAAEANEQEST